VRFQEQEQEVVADEEGHFSVWIEPRQPLADQRLWHQIEIELLDPIPDEQRRHPVKAVGEVLVPPPTARHVVVSDIDDTVLQSDATHLIKMARHVFLGNAHTRLPFPGVAALYRALFHGASGEEMNPMFYVSSSPWNLYDLLAQFFHLQDIPIGPVLFLRNWGVSEDELLPTRHVKYKKNTIRQMLDFYPDLPFILIGDSGQEDPEIYADLVREYPERIEAVYIRSVKRNLERPAEIEKLAKEVMDAGSALVLADDSLAIAKHALQMGYIKAEALPDIGEEKKKDEAPPTVIEKMLGETTKEEGKTVHVTRAEVEKEGEIEEKVKKEGKEETSAPPSVIVEGEQAKEQKKNQSPD
jgi:phosphatidate phosphatase APP1